MAACGVTKMTVLLLGDSFLGRLRDWAWEQDKINLNLDSTRIKVEWEVKGGMHANRKAKNNLWQHKDAVIHTRPNSVLLSIGSNDLSSCSVSPQTVRDRILEFVSFCTQQGVSSVIVFQLLPRLGQYPTFNDKVASVNDLLIQDSKVRNDLYVWEHSRQHFYERYLDSFVDYDGTHMNPTGLVKFYTSVRGAVLLAENKCKGLINPID